MIFSHVGWMSSSIRQLQEKSGRHEGTVKTFWPRINTNDTNKQMSFSKMPQGLNADCYLPIAICYLPIAFLSK
jgi:hypothetical protein